MSLIQQRIYRAVVGIFTALLIMAGCSSGEKMPQPAKKVVSTEKLTYCYGGVMPSLLALATAKDLFAAEGLEVTLKAFPLGNNALDELLAGNCDVAGLVETPLVIKSFERDDLRVLTALRSTSNLGRIVARRDKGIRTVADLKGRRVGIPKGTAPHFFLDLELAKNGLSEKAITPIFLESGILLPSIENGSVDAIATINTMAFRAKQKLGDKAVVIEEPGLCLNFSLLVSMQEYALKNPERIRRLLTALHAAEMYLKHSPEKARDIVIASLKLPEAEYNEVWEHYDDRLTLDNALLLTLEEHARWVLDNGIVKGGRIPNFLTLIDAGHLQKVAPEALRLKR